MRPGSNMDVNHRRCAEEENEALHWVILMLYWDLNALFCDFRGILGFFEKIIVLLFAYFKNNSYLCRRKIKINNNQEVGATL